MADIPEDQKCVYNFLGKSGLRVSNMCLGTMTFGETTFGLPNQVSQANAHQILDRFVQYGGNFIDTADMYGAGKAEEIVGTWLTNKSREDVVVATKVRYNMGTETDANNIGLSRRHITTSIERSLERLQTNYVDLYHTHGFDNGVPLEETLRTMDDLVRAGKIRYSGVCNVSGWQLQKIINTTEKLGLNSVIDLQHQYSLLCRESEWEPFQVVKEEGLGVMTWSPLRGGGLTGKVKRNKPATEGRQKWINDNKDVLPTSFAIMAENNFDLLDEVEKIADAKGKTMAQVSLRWLLQRDVVSSVILGVRTLEQLNENLGAANGWSLTKEEMDSLTKLSDPGLPYPYEVVVFGNADRVNKKVFNYFVESTY